MSQTSSAAPRDKSKNRPTTPEVEITKTGTESNTPTTPRSQGGPSQTSKAKRANAARVVPIKEESKPKAQRASVASAGKPSGQGNSGKENREGDGDISSHIPPSERAGQAFAQRLENYIQKNRGQYVKDEDGSLHVILGSRRIDLNLSPENHELTRLMLTACNVGTLALGAKSAIQRLQVRASGAASRIKLRKFSALAQDAQTLYVAMNSGKLLQVTAHGITEIANGSNADSFWVEHPEGTPFKYLATEPKAGLDDFERLLVDSQACHEPSMRWFVAMAEGLFPYIRDAFPARLIVVHTGPSQQGKTTGAGRFTLLHGLGDVKGDYSVAALRNIGDIGLLVLDNKEQANFNQALIDFCLFAATGAESARSSRDGQLRRSGGFRPVIVITTIEGVFRDELQKRCVEVEYRIPGEGYPRDVIESEIRQRRDEISSALMVVLQTFLRNRQNPHPCPNPLPSFSEHFGALCNLLRAYSQVAGKPRGWAEGIIADWNTVLGEREQDEDELEHPILRVLGVADDLEKEPSIFDLIPPASTSLEWRGKVGKLFVTNVASLLTSLQKLNLRYLNLPRNAAGLGRRLRKPYRSFYVLDEQSAPDLPSLKRKGNVRPIGFFIPDDGVTE